MRNLLFAICLAGAIVAPELAANELTIPPIAFKQRILANGLQVISV